MITKSGRRELGSFSAGLLLLLVAAAYVVNAMDRQVFPVLLSSIIKYYHLSFAEGGLLSTIFTIGLGISGYFAGWLADRTSRKFVMLLGIAIYSLFTLTTALAIGYYDLLAYRILTGFGEGFQNAALFAAVGSYFFRRRALAIGFTNIAYGVGLILGPLLGGRLAHTTGLWQTPFYYYAAIGAVFFVLILLLVPREFTERKPQEDRLSAISYDNVPEKLFNRNLIVTFVTIIMAGFSLYAFIGLYPSFLVKHLDFGLIEESTVVSFYGYGVFFSPITGYIASKVSNKWFLVFALLAFSVNSYLGFAVFTTYYEQVVFAFLEGLFASGMAYVIMYSLIQRTVRPNFVGRASGLFVIGFYTPSAFSGYIFAELATAHSFAFAALIQLVLIPLVGVVSILLLNERGLIVVRPSRGAKEVSPADPK